MKKLYLCGIAACIAVSALAKDDYVTPVIIDDMVAQRVSADGNWIAGQDVLGSVVYAYNVKEGSTPIMYHSFVIGNGNCVANNGMIVGQQISNAELACLMFNGQYNVLYSTKSTLDAITPDGTRAAGYKTSNGSVMFTPFVVDINPDGTFGKVTNLNYPRKDFFGMPPQWVTAVSISDDGKTVVGTVLSNDGFFSWPIIFTEDANGKWTYVQPTEADFNPDNLPLPQYPHFTWGQNGAPAQPKPADYMTAEEYAAWQAYCKEYPEFCKDVFEQFMSPDEVDAYEQAVIDFNKAADEYMGDKLDKYWEAMKALGKDEQYDLNVNVISPDGKIMAAVKGHSDDPRASDIMDYHNPYIYNLETKESELIPTKKTDWIIPRQFLPNGTIVAVSSPMDFLPFVAYLLPPGETEFISFMDWLEKNAPAYYFWLDDSDLTLDGLTGYDDDGKPIYGRYTITGYVSLSYNLKTIAGGYPNGNGFSYVYEDTDNYVDGVAAPIVEPEGDGHYYNLQGIRVSNPTPGIYIRNGKKIIIK